MTDKMSITVGVGDICGQLVTGVTDLRSHTGGHFRIVRAFSVTVMTMVMQQ